MYRRGKDLAVVYDVDNNNDTSESDRVAGRSCKKNDYARDVKDVERPAIHVGGAFNATTPACAHALRPADRCAVGCRGMRRT